MNGCNILLLIGNLGQDPEKTVTQSGQSLCKPSIAIPNRVKKGQDAEGRDIYVDQPDWIRLTIWGKNADFVSKYGKKGDTLSVRGRMKPNKYTDKEGVTRYEMLAVVDEVLNLENKAGRRAIETDQNARREVPAEAFEAPVDDAPPIDMP